MACGGDATPAGTNQNENAREPENTNTNTNTKTNGNGNGNDSDPPSLTRVEIASFDDLALGLDVQLTVEGVYDDDTRAALAELEFDVSPASRATVDSTGLLTTLAEGEVTLTATHPPSATSDSFVFTVLPPAPVRLEILPGPAPTAVDVERRLRVNRVFTDDTREPVTSGLVWSTDSATATVDGSAVRTNA